MIAHVVSSLGCMLLVASAVKIPSETYQILIGAVGGLLISIAINRLVNKGV